MKHKYLFIYLFFLVILIFMQIYYQKKSIELYEQHIDLIQNISRSIDDSTSKINFLID